MLKSLEKWNLLCPKSKKKKKTTFSDVSVFLPFDGTEEIPNLQKEKQAKFQEAVHTPGCLSPF